MGVTGRTDSACFRTLLSRGNGEIAETTPVYGPLDTVGQIKRAPNGWFVVAEVVYTEILDRNSLSLW
jgi:hypothetical protein